MNAVGPVGMSGGYSGFATLSAIASNGSSSCGALALPIDSSATGTSISAQISSFMQSPEAVSNKDMLNTLLLLAAMKLLDSDDKKDDDKKSLAGLLILAAASRQQHGGISPLQSQSLSFTQGAVKLNGDLGGMSHVSLGQMGYSSIYAGGSVATSSSIDISA